MPAVTVLVEWSVIVSDEIDKLVKKLQTRNKKEVSFVYVFYLIFISI